MRLRRPAVKAWLIAGIFILALTGAVRFPASLSETVPAGDHCPPPRVRTIHGPQGEMAKTAAENYTFTFNQGSIRFYEFLPGRGRPTGDEYLLVGRQTDRSVSLTLTDSKDRVVASSTAPIYDGAEMNAGEAAARNISPLLPKIREHQRRVREEENGAVYVHGISVSPGFELIKVGESVRIEAELKDCDGYILEGRNLLFELIGVGSLSSSEAITDADGIATVTYTGDSRGTATINVYWEYRSTQDVPMLAFTYSPAHIQVDDGGGPAYGIMLQGGTPQLRPFPPSL